MYTITKTIIVFDNGDKRIFKDKIDTSDIEKTRADFKEKYECKKVSFTYEEKQSDA